MPERRWTRERKENICYNYILQYSFAILNKSKCVWVRTYGMGMSMSMRVYELDLNETLQQQQQTWLYCKFKGWQGFDWMVFFTLTDGEAVQKRFWRGEEKRMKWKIK